MMKLKINQLRKNNKKNDQSQPGSPCQTRESGHET
jgi:hypothetical protein